MAIRFTIYESGTYQRRSHLDIDDNFLTEINANLQVQTDNQNTIKITEKNIIDAMTKKDDNRPTIMIKDCDGNEFDLYDFISDYTYDSFYWCPVVEDIDYDNVYSMWKVDKNN